MTHPDGTGAAAHPADAPLTANKDEPLAYLNGEFIPADECKLPVYDLGIVLGAAVTDFLRTFGGRPYRLADHVRRLYRSCRYAHIDPPIDAEESMEVSRRLIAHNRAASGGAELGLIYYVTAGQNRVYAGAAGSQGPRQATYVQHTFPMPFHLWKPLFTRGAHCVTPSNRHWPPECLSSKIKNRNRLHMWIGDHQAHQIDPDAIAVYLDVHGNITETGGSNFVIYRDGQVVAPRRRNVLWGISLTVLTELLPDLGIGFVEDDLQTWDAVNAEEAWLPTTPYCLAPVVRFNGVPIGDGAPGPVWRRVLDRWSEVAGTDIYGEIAGSSA